MHIQSLEWFCSLSFFPGAVLVFSKVPFQQNTRKNAKLSHAKDVVDPLLSVKLHFHHGAVCNRKTGKVSAKL